MKVIFNITIEMNGEHSKTITTSPASNALAMIIAPEEYKQDVANAAHLLVCSAIGLAGSAGVDAKTLLSLKTPWMDKEKTP
jgi:hypothetical protein